MTRSKFTHGMIERLLVINNELGTEKYPNTPKLATVNLVVIGVLRNVWWFGQSDTWAPTVDIGYP